MHEWRRTVLVIVLGAGCIVGWHLAVEREDLIGAKPVSAVSVTSPRHGPVESMTVGAAGDSSGQFPAGPAVPAHLPSNPVSGVVELGPVLDPMDDRPPIANDTSIREIGLFSDPEDAPVIGSFDLSEAGKSIGEPIDPASPGPYYRDDEQSRIEIGGQLDPEDYLNDSVPNVAVPTAIGEFLPVDIDDP